MTVIGSRAALLSIRWDAAARAAGVARDVQGEIAARVAERAAFLWRQPGMTWRRVQLYVAGDLHMPSSLMSLSRAAGIDLPAAALRQVCTLPRQSILALRPNHLAKGEPSSWPAPALSTP